MNIKKMLAGVSLLLILVLAACSSGNNNDTSSNKNDGDNDDDVVTISYYTWEGEASEDLINEKIKNFEAEKPGIKVDYKALVKGNDDVEYNKKIDIQTSNGQQIDIFAHTYDVFYI